MDEPKLVNKPTDQYPAAFSDLTLLVEG